MEGYSAAFWLDEWNGRAEGETEASEGSNVVKIKLYSSFVPSKLYLRRGSIRSD
jgi:hypothetical protein